MNRGHRELCASERWGTLHPRDARAVGPWRPAARRERPRDRPGSRPDDGRASFTDPEGDRRRSGRRGRRTSRSTAGRHQRHGRQRRRDGDAVPPRPVQRRGRDDDAPPRPERRGAGRAAGRGLPGPAPRRLDAGRRFARQPRLPRLPPRRHLRPGRPGDARSPAARCRVRRRRGRRSGTTRFASRRVALRSPIRPAIPGGTEMSFPYEEPLVPRAPGERIIPEPPRRGEPGGEPCGICTGESSRTGLVERPVDPPSSRSTAACPGTVWLASRDHVDSFSDLPEAAAADFGKVAARVERAILSLGDVGRVHLYRWGDGGAHFHVWFIPRPLGMLEASGRDAAALGGRPAIGPRRGAARRPPGASQRRWATRPARRGPRP